jgi:transcriptional regulator with XRE-family HTH domain
MFYKRALGNFVAWCVASKELIQIIKGTMPHIAKPNNIDYTDSMTYSLDFRRKVLSVRKKEGLTIAEVASRFDVGVASVTRWLKDIHPKEHGFRQRKVDMGALALDILDYPDDYQYERAARFGVHQNAIFHGLNKLKVSYKKNTGASQGGRRQTAYLPAKD